ncbi:MAG TPA: PH domain-containing protein [Bryobacteraceae bacterium]|nr:PH domain-containing protein [Bryobacteraceae bacterium]
MSEMKIRPSTTLVIATYLLALVLAGGIFYYTQDQLSQAWLLAYAIPGIMLLSAAVKHIRTRFTTLEIVGDRMKYESGMLSRTTRSMPLQKIQDVTVRQTFGQRLLGLGDLIIETAGEQSQLTIREINSPRVAAEQILDRVAQFSPPRNDKPSTK